MAPEYSIRPRVVWLCLEWPNDRHSGGVARYAYRLANVVSSSVDLVVITEDGGERLDSAQMLYLPRSKGRLDRYYRQPFRARRALASLESFDIVHSFGDDWALRLHGHPLVRHFLGSSRSEATASAGLRKWNHYVLAALEKRSRRISAFRVAIGPESNAEFDCDAVMPPVVKPQTSPGEKSDRATVVFVGSFYGRKRGAWAEKAVKAARAQLKIEIDLLVFGPPEDRQNWSSETIHVSGADDQTVHEAIARAWLVASPSSYEGFGIPIFEGLALGTPIVATSNPGSEYQAAVVRNSDALALVESESEFISAVTERIANGGVLSAATREVMDSATRQLLLSGSAQRLVDDIYRRLIS